MQICFEMEQLIFITFQKKNNFYFSRILTLRPIYYFKFLNVQCFLLFNEFLINKKPENVETRRR